MLRIEKITKNFGGLAALAELDIDVEQREILGLIGPNGAGKTTLFNVITGTFPPTHGRVIYKGEDITGKKPHLIARRGIARSFQANVRFREMSVWQQVIMGCHLVQKTGVAGGFFNLRSSRQEEEYVRRKSMEALEFMGLAHVKDEAVVNLPHGYQRALGIATALACDPELLLLDEPVTGMNVEEKEDMMKRIENTRSRGITVMLIDHDMKTIMSLCDRIVALNYGRKIAEGLPQAIAHNQAVIEAYLGTEGVRGVAA